MESFPALFFQRAAALAGRVALREKENGIWNELSWEQYAAQVRRTARAMLAFGARPGEAVAILGENRREWLYCDLAAMAIGGMTCGVYPTCSAEQVAYIVGHAGARLFFVENEEQLDKALEVRARVAMEKIIVWDRRGLWGFTDPGVLFFDEFLDRGGQDWEGPFEDRLKAVGGEDTAVLIYTSGTTGPPKGAMLSHRNILAIAESLGERNDVRETDQVLSYLPLCHIYERLLSVILAVHAGYTVNFVESIDTLFQNIREVSPTFFGSVPRIWEKLLSQIEIRMADSTWLKRRLYRLAVENSRRVVRARMAALASTLGTGGGVEMDMRLSQNPIHPPKVLQSLKALLRGKSSLSVADPPVAEPSGSAALAGSAMRFGIGAKSDRAVTEGNGVGPMARALHALASRTIFWNLRRLLGFERVRFALCGAAPASPDLFEFYHAIGIPLHEGYGQTESSGVISGHRLGHARRGTVGEPLSCVEVRIAGDGEILARGPGVFKGYYKDPELTAQTIRDGWLHTGDVGVVDDGHLRILDRKKDIIITAGGKNITPSYIENKLKFSPYVQDAVVIGDGRKYLVALILIEEDNVTCYAQEKKIVFTTFADLTQNPEIVKLIGREIDEVNRTLSQVESIKKFALLPRRFYEEDGDVTPTKKVKRSALEKKYADVIAGLYKG